MSSPVPFAPGVLWPAVPMVRILPEVGNNERRIVFDPALRTDGEPKLKSVAVAGAGDRIASSIQEESTACVCSAESRSGPQDAIGRCHVVADDYRCQSVTGKGGKPHRLLMPASGAMLFVINTDGSVDVTAEYDNGLLSAQGRGAC